MTLRIHPLFTVARPRALLACGLLLEAFTAEAQNLGNVPVELAIATAGETRVVAEIAPNEVAQQRFARGQSAVFINRSSAEASLYVAIRGDTELGMRYVPAE